jgi:glutamyl-tRNA reductase
MTSVLVLGLSHRTARVEQREKASLAEPAARALLRALRDTRAVSECAVLSTCNRTEIAAVADDPSAAAAALSRSLVEHSRISAFELWRASYLLCDETAVRHLFRVAASLDSMVVGESEIQGQVRSARELARDVGTVGKQLDRAFACALRTGSHVRTQTRLAEGAVSVCSVAVELARTALGELRAADVVISSTDAPDTIISVDGVAPGRRVLIDIAVPRDIDARAGDVPGVRLHNIDDLERIVEANLNGRRREAARAESIVEREVRRFTARAAEAA